MSPSTITISGTTNPSSLLRPRRQKIGGSVFAQDDPGAVKCTICLDRMARYTCPECNLRYCRLDCFKSEAHLICSESFYKRSLLEDVDMDPTASIESKKEMLKMLSRLEKSSLEESQEDDLEEDSKEFLEVEEDFDEQALDHLNTEQLLALLSPEQIQEFEARLQHKEIDPLLLDQTIQSDYSTPWWLSQSKIDEEYLGGAEFHGVDSLSGFTPPDTLSPHLLPKLPPSPNLEITFQVIIVILGYSYTIRRFGLYSLQSIMKLSVEEQTDLLLRTVEAVPPLFEADGERAKIPTTLSDCVFILMESLGLDASEIEQVEDLLMSDFCQLAQTMLDEASRTEKIVETVSEVQSPEINNLAVALSDLHTFLDHCSSNTSSDLTPPTPNPVKRKTLKKSVMKLRFYISFILARPSGIEKVWIKIRSEMDRKAIKTAPEELTTHVPPTIVLLNPEPRRPTNLDILTCVTSQSPKIVELT